MSKPHVTRKNGIWYAIKGMAIGMGLTPQCAIKSLNMLRRGI